MQASISKSTMAGLGEVSSGTTNSYNSARPPEAIFSGIRLKIPPKHAVASVIGLLKGKSAIAIARRRDRERNFSGGYSWASGYAVSTVGFELEQIRQSIREQDVADGADGKF
jgi:hypothetical protein